MSLTSCQTAPPASGERDYSTLLDAVQQGAGNTPQRRIGSHAEHARRATRIEHDDPAGFDVMGLPRAQRRPGWASGSRGTPPRPTARSRPGPARPAPPRPRRRRPGCRPGPRSRPAGPRQARNSDPSPASVFSFPSCFSFAHRWRTFWARAAGRNRHTRPRSVTQQMGRPCSVMVEFPAICACTAPAAAQHHRNMEAHPLPQPLYQRLAEHYRRAIRPARWRPASACRRCAG